MNRWNKLKYKMSEFQTVKAYRYIQKLLYHALNYDAQAAGPFIVDAVIPFFNQSKITLTQLDLWFQSDNVNEFIESYNDNHSAQLMLTENQWSLVKHNTLLIPINFIVSDTYPFVNVDKNCLSYYNGNEGDCFEYHKYDKELGNFVSIELLWDELISLRIYQRIMNKQTYIIKPFLTEMLNSYIPKSSQLNFLNNLAKDGWTIKYKKITFPSFITFDWLRQHFDCNQYIDLVSLLDKDYLLKFLDANPYIAKQLATHYNHGSIPTLTILAGTR